MLKAAARTVNAPCGKQYGTGNARGKGILFCDCLAVCSRIVGRGLPGVAACAPMPFGFGLYVYAERLEEAWNPPKFR